MTSTTAINTFPKISIISPSFNQGHLLEETILSVVNQNYPNLEYIIIDGGSTDSSVDIVRKYQKNLSYWLSEHDRGQAHAINKGIHRSTGEIVAYLNSDDIYLPGTLRTVSEFFMNHKEIDIVYGDCLIIDEKSRTIKKRKEISFDYLMGCFIGFSTIMSQPTVFVRRRVFHQVGDFNEELVINLDGDYWFRCAQTGMRFKHIPFFLAGFRIHPDSKTTSMTKKNKQLWNQEYHAVLREAYQTLPVSRIIPYDFSAPFRQIYRIKRILKKLCSGCYPVVPLILSFFNKRYLKKD